MKAHAREERRDGKSRRRHHRPTHVERVRTIGRRDFEREFVAENRPLVVTSAIDHWPAMRLWQDEDYFRRTIGHRTAEIYGYPNGDLYDERTMTIDHFPVAEYMDAMDDPARQDQYALMCELATLPELVPSVSLPALFDHDRLKNVRFHLRRDSVTVNHYHPFLESFLCQITGEKRVVLYPPEDTAQLYPNPFYQFPHSASSAVDPGQPDLLERYPRFAHAHPIELTLRPGEMLYIPLHWWHWVTGKDLVVSVAIFWYARLRAWQFPTPAMDVLVGFTAEKLLRRFLRGHG